MGVAMLTLDWFRMLDAATLCMACVALIFAMAEMSPLFGFGIVVLAVFAAWRFIPPLAVGKPLKGL